MINTSLEKYINRCSTPCGNKTTNLMHFFTLQELKQSRDFEFFSLKEEKALYKKTPVGAYDFFLETVEGKRIGIEILTRPSKGKLKKKLEMYSPRVDEFIFVIPHNTLKFYRKKPKIGLHLIAKQKSFPKQFNNKNLKAWLFNIEKREFIEKKTFCKIFNVEQ